jgi:hypothetical protein
LPKDIKKLAKESKIPTEELDAHFDVLLNILHFFTKKVFYTREDEPTEPKVERTERSDTILDAPIINNNNAHHEESETTEATKTSKVRSLKAQLIILAGKERILAVQGIAASITQQLERRYSSGSYSKIHMHNFLYFVVT